MRYHMYINLVSFSHIILYKFQFNVFSSRTKKITHNIIYSAKFLSRILNDHGRSKFISSWSFLIIRHIKRFVQKQKEIWLHGSPIDDIVRMILTKNPIENIKYGAINWKPNDWQVKFLNKVLYNFYMVYVSFILGVAICVSCSFSYREKIEYHQRIKGKKRTKTK